ncbi:MAG: sugar phosphate nucleotidyltransferase [Parachlamydiales bacterium]|jgi:glucose-1-phosphate adenylyltransferase
MSVQINNKNVSITSVVLAGGQGTRLFPLTLRHCKPAVLFGGRYRLIDIPLSNSLNSNIKEIFVIAQYNTRELKSHIQTTYGSPLIKFVTPQELSTGGQQLFEGTADAIRKTANRIFKNNSDYILILSGDQLYNIDFHEMLNFAIKKNADLTIATLPVSREDAPRMGILKTDSEHLITEFVEKPKDEKTLSSLQMDEALIQKVAHNFPHPISHLGSMGIYIFKRQALEKLLKEHGADFGKDLIPLQMQRGKTFAYFYDGYWEDIGTVESFYKANLSLIHSNFALKTYDEQKPIYSKTSHLPGAKIWGTSITSSMICDGTIIEAQEIKNSIIGQRSCIKEKTIIEDSIILGHPNYHALDKHFSIGSNCLIKKAILDEGVKIGHNVKLENQQNLKNYDSEELFVRNGLIIVPANTILPDNFTF